nr:initiation control protein YabA [Thermococcus bergensis]
MIKRILCKDLYEEIERLERSVIELEEQIIELKTQLNMKTEEATSLYIENQSLRHKLEVREHGATRGSSPVDFFMGETRDEKGESSPEAHSSEIFNLTTPNDSVVAPTVERLISAQISYGKVLYIIETASKVGLLVVGFSIFLVMISSLVVK